MQTGKKRSAVFLFILLFGFWIILAADIDALSLSIGLMAALFVVLYGYDMVFSSQEASRFTFGFLIQGVKLFFLLLKGIVISNIQVAKIVLTPSLPIKPGFKTIKQPLKKDVNRTFYGNSITLTPGTLTVKLNEDEIIVHGLEPEYLEALNDSEIQKSFVKLERL